MKNFYISNRERLAQLMDDNSAAILLSGGEVTKTGDENYPFTPSCNFLYLTGIAQPGVILLLAKQGGEVSQTLFIPPFDEEQARWTGAVMLPDEAKAISGIDDIKYDYKFYDILAGVLFGKRIQSVWLDLENRTFFRNSGENDLADMIKRGYPHIGIKNLYNVLADMRRTKQPHELEKIRRAAEITGMGIEAMLKNVHPGMREYALEAYFDFALKTNGVKEHAFKSIVASGKNAAVLHYSDNSDVIADNSLVLCDVGARWEYYCGDVTRTFPANGHFSDRQRLLYNTVLEGQRRVMSAIRPGVPFKSLNETLLKYYETALADIGLIDTAEQVKKYYWHGVSHMLGIETHDAGRHNEGLLEPGMVLTVEPGLYIAEEGIGIRIEDDVVVTENGCSVLSDGIPKTVEEIESAMNG